MCEPHRALLAVKVRLADHEDDDEEELAELGLPFRAEPLAVYEIYANLSIANMDFEDFAAGARTDPEGVLRAF
jgi:hypothetical protein